MVASYEEYLKTSRAFSIEDMLQLYYEMNAEIGTDENAIEIYDELVDSAVRYARFRAERSVLNSSKKRALEESQTSSHNSVIIKLNVLARYLQTLGEKTKWRDVLGRDENNLNVRKRIGDFACFLVFMNCIISD